MRSEVPHVLKKGKSKNYLDKQGIRVNVSTKQGLAFCSKSPRFKEDEESLAAHIKNRTLNVDDTTKPVYELQILEGPQIKA